MNENLQKWYDKYSEDAVHVAKEIWSHPEIVFGEHHACAVSAELLEKNGFDVKRIDARGRGEEPNCVIATYGSGKPEVVILGELDALMGLGQEAVPYRAPIEGAGHGCGHCLFAAAGTAAACALKAAMEAEGIKGTLKFYGCPAEEGGSGKLYLIKDGYFDSADIVLSWHPSGNPFYFEMSESVARALDSISFEFFGKSAHAGANPELGRSALDAAELMNVGVQYLREHVSPEVRMHSAYESTGNMPPNVVPEYSKLKYYVRAGNRQQVDETVERVENVARGAALMTGTEVKWAMNSRCSETLVNHAINRYGYRAALKIPRIEYSEEDKAFAKEIYKNVYDKEADFELLPTEPLPPKGVAGKVYGSSDIGDVSQLVPTIQYDGLGVICGIPPHHWAVTACTGSGIGEKGMLFGSKAVAQLGYDAFTDPAVIKDCQDELKEARKGVPPYVNPMFRK